MIYASKLGSFAMSHIAGISDLDNFLAIGFFLVPHNKVVK